MDRWSEVDDIFTRALELPAREREALGSEIARTDPALGAEVSALLEVVRDAARSSRTGSKAVAT